MLAAAVVDNLPEVPPEKFGKLSGLLKKLFSQVGPQGLGLRLNNPFLDVNSEAGLSEI